MNIANCLLWTLVIALGIQTGGGLFETRVLVPLWSSSPPESVLAYSRQPMRPDSGRRFWIYLTPLVGAISVVNLIVAWTSVGQGRTWWLSAAVTGTVVVAVTFAYFVPALMRLLRTGEQPGAEVVAQVRWWVRLNWVRVVVLAGLVSSTKSSLLWRLIAGERRVV